jgi:hypothetical protein
MLRNQLTSRSWKYRAAFAYGCDGQWASMRAIYMTLLLSYWSKVLLYCTATGWSEDNMLHRMM